MILMIQLHLQIAQAASTDLDHSILPELLGSSSDSARLSCCLGKSRPAACQVCSAKLNRTIKCRISSPIIRSPRISCAKSRTGPTTRVCVKNCADLRIQAANSSYRTAGHRSGIGASIRCSAPAASPRSVRCGSLTGSRPPNPLADSERPRDDGDAAAAPVPGGV
jgi:hypothetical protein